MRMLWKRRPDANGRLRWGIATATLWLALLASSITYAESVSSVDALSGEDAAQLEYVKAQSSMAEGNYSQALQTLRLLVRNYPNFSDISKARTRISVLSEAVDAGAALVPYLQALDQRDRGEPLHAIESLRRLIADYPNSTLVDDALYLSAYIQVLDRYDFAAALKLLEMLKQQHPSGSYADAGDYLEAISLEQMGHTRQAQLAFMSLRDKHTALALPFGYRWPKGNVMSRYWYERANGRLEILNLQLKSASAIKTQRITAGGILELSINIAGVDYDLVLTPSPLTRGTSWRDGSLEDIEPPAVGVFAGVVKGQSASWARIVFSESTLSGVVFVEGEQHYLQPENLMGTIDYYQPASRSSTVVRSSDGSVRVEGDVLIPPPQGIDAKLLRNQSSLTDLRIVPISIVIDSQYDRYHSGEGLTAALNHLNVTDGFFRESGLALVLDETLVLSEGDDPMALGATTLETVLRTFRDYRRGRATLFNDSALVYLFSGNPRTDATIGLAWIDTACRTDGYDVGVATPSSFGDVLLAHELGHSLGSAHDTDTSCSDDAGYLMWPNISSRTPLDFSSCSSESVMSARSRACLMNAVDMTLAADTDGSTVTFTLNNPDTSVVVHADLTLETTAPNQLLWPASCTEETPTRASCRNLTVAASGKLDVQFPVGADHVDNASMVTAHVSPGEFLDPSMANNVISTHLLFNSANNPEIPASIVTPQLTVTANDQQQPTTTGAASGAFGWCMLLLTGLAFIAKRRRPISTLPV